MKRLVLLAAIAGLQLGCGGRGGAPRPNIVLISIDTLRPDFLGCYGHERPSSPSIDELAARGTLFTDVTSASPWTLPSHATMLTGLYPSHHGIVDHVFQLESETLATRLSAAGYQTMAVVNSHNIGDARYGLLRGFDAQKAEYVAEMDPPTGGPIVNRGSAVTKKAISALEERDPNRPFFLFLHYYDVHSDFTPAPEWKLEFVGPYDGKLDGTTAQLSRWRSRGIELSEADVRWLHEMYAAEIRTLDAILERLFDHLEASGLAESTLVVLTSDHGEEFYEHKGLLHGRTHYQELIRIPLILCGPGVPKDRRIDEPVHLVDVAPTIFALAGVAAPSGLDGVDLSALWRDPGSMPSPRMLFGEADHNNVIDGKEVANIKRMVREGDAKLCYDTVTKRKELYDLRTDPEEKNDLAASDADRVGPLWDGLEAFMAGSQTGSYKGPVDDETLQKLVDLGYVADESAAPGEPAAHQGTPSVDEEDAIAAMKRAAAELAARPEHDLQKVEVQHLLVSFKDVLQSDATRSRDEAEKLAAELFARVRAGEDFDALVKQYTDDSYPGVYAIVAGRPSSAGEYARRRMARAFGDACWRLEVGEIGIALFEDESSPYGWHVIKRTR